MACRVDVRSTENPQGSVPLWTVTVMDGEATVFSSAAQPLRFVDENAAALLGRAIAALIDAGVSLDDTGIAWTGDLDSRCTAELGRFQALAERLDGAVDGGVWYCVVSDTMYSPRAGILPLDGDAARWLCGIFAHAAQQGFSGAG